MCTLSRTELVSKDSPLAASMGNAACPPACALWPGHAQPRAASSCRETPVTSRPRAGGEADINPRFRPRYLSLHKRGELKARAQQLWDMMERCELCPRRCGANRLKGERGFCGSTAELEISAYHPHYGEEKPLVGRGGSGTIFLTHCSMRCVFCINWQISQGGCEAPRTVEEMAEIMIRLQEMGCHNINFVTPTHYSPHVLRAVDLAAARGLRLPLVYNTSGWERLKILKMLDGVVDIYLPDIKYSAGRMAARYSSDAESYPRFAKAALLEMNRQVGSAHPAPDGLMYRGLMIRHLVMPGKVSGTKAVVEWIARNLPKDTYLNLMSQYMPAFMASQHPQIARRITHSEYSEVVATAKANGLTNLDIQGYRN